MCQKLLKVDENNQYGNAMTKPLPTSIIKRMKKIPSYIELDLIIQTISDKDKIEYIYFLLTMNLTQNTDDYFWKEKSAFAEGLYFSCLMP